MLTAMLAVKHSNIYEQVPDCTNARNVNSIADSLAIYRRVLCRPLENLYFFQYTLRRYETKLRLFLYL